MFWFITKKKHNKIVSEMEEVLSDYEQRCLKLSIQLDATLDEMDKFRAAYPFQIGQTVYDVQLRNEKGRYTKTNPVCEYSKVNEVVVDKKNYFNLVERMKAKDVFTSYEAAIERLHEVCVKDH